MNWFTQFSSSPFTWFCGWALIHSAWQIVVFWALYKSYCRSTREQNSRSRYVVGFATMIVAFVLPLITATLVQPGRDFFQPAVANASPERTQSETVSMLPDWEKSNLTVEHETVTPFPTQSPPGQTGKPLGAAAAAGTTTEDSAGNSTATAAEKQKGWLQALPMFLPLIVIVYLAGLAVFSFRPISGVVQMLRLRNSKSPVPTSVADRFAQLVRQSRLRKPIEIAESALVKVPSVIGMFRPLVLLPASTLSCLSAKELDAILLHELGHIRRSDVLFNFAQSLIETFLFYHPLLWSISKQVRAEREKCCDDLAATTQAERKTLALALVRLEETRQQQMDLLTHPIAVAALGGQLKGRIERLLIPPQKTNGPQPPRGILLSSLLALTVIAFLCANSLIVPANAGQPSTDEWKVVRATVQHRGNIFEWDLLETTDPETAQKVADLFPQADSGKTGGTPAGWKSDTIFTIYKQNLSTQETRPVVIRASFEAGKWTEGEGDWEFGPTWPLRRLIFKLVREQKAARTETPKATPFASLDDLKKLPPQTRYLQFRSRDDYTLKDDWLKLIATRFKELEVLEIPNARSLTDKGVAHLSSLKKLYALKLGFAEKLKVASARSLASIESLELLDASYSRGICNDGACVEYKKLPGLRFLILPRHSANGITKRSTQLINEHSTLRQLLITDQHPISKSAQAIPRLVMVDDHPGNNWFESYLQINQNQRLNSFARSQRKKEQAKNEKAYRINARPLAAVEKGKWVVIANGKMTSPFDSRAAANKFADRNYKASHCLIFRPGIDDVDEKPFHLSPWKYGSPNWSQLGRQFHFDQKITVSTSKWVRDRKSVNTPNGKAALQLTSVDGKNSLTRHCVMSGMFQRQLTITESDAVALGLFRNSIPGSVIYGKDTRCDRVICQVSIAGLDIKTTVVAFVIPEETVGTDPPKVNGASADIPVVGTTFALQMHRIRFRQAKIIQFKESIKEVFNESAGNLKIIPVSKNQMMITGHKLGKFHFTAVSESGVRIRCQIDVVDANSAPNEVNDKRAAFDRFVKPDNEFVVYATDNQFYAYGKVTDADGKPIANAVVRASARRGKNPDNTGIIKTDENGKYVLRFGPGFYQFIPNDFSNPLIPCQPIFIVAEKKGMFERDMQRNGIRFVADQLPREGDFQSPYGTASAIAPRTILKGYPTRIDFVLRSAADIKGILVDEKGSAIQFRNITLAEKAAPPSGIKLDNKYSRVVQTDSIGRFQFDNVPKNTDLVVSAENSDGKIVGSTNSFNVEAEAKHWIKVSFAINKRKPMVSITDLKEDPFKDVFRLFSRIRGSKPPKKDTRKLVFGKQVDGLAAAIFIEDEDAIRSELPQQVHGDQVNIQIVVRNNSDKVMHFRSSSWRQEDRLTVIDSDGASVDRISKTWYSGWAIMLVYELHPGEECLFDSGAIGIASPEDDVTSFSHPVVYTVPLEKGVSRLKMKIKMPDIITTTGETKGEWKGELTTGETPIQVN